VNAFEITCLNCGNKTVIRQINQDDQLHIKKEPQFGGIEIWQYNGDSGYGFTCEKCKNNVEECY
jgi:hypothetical protein